LAARDAWHVDRERLEAQVGKLVRDMVSDYGSGPVGNTLKQPGTADKITQGIFEAMFRAMIDNESQVEKYINPKQIPNGSAIFFCGSISDTELTVEDTKIAVIIAKFCRDIAKSLFAHKKLLFIDDIIVSIARMREAHNELTYGLDEIRLTPIILQTKCNICPA
jgi:hypothetical protein